MGQLTLDFLGDVPQRGVLTVIRCRRSADAGSYANKCEITTMAGEAHEEAKTFQNNIL